MTVKRMIDSSTGKILERKNTPMINGSDIKDWKTYRNEEYGFEVKYPENPREIGLKYISTTIKWPSKIKIKPIDPNFSCQRIECSFAREESCNKNDFVDSEFIQNYPEVFQEEIIFNNSNYCILKGAEGTAGSTYS